MNMPVDQQMLQQEDLQQQQYMQEEHYERVGAGPNMGGMTSGSYQGGQMNMEGDQDGSESPEANAARQMANGNMQNQLGQYMA